MATMKRLIYFCTRESSFSKPVPPLGCQARSHVSYAVLALSPAALTPLVQALDWLAVGHCPWGDRTEP